MSDTVWRVRARAEGRRGWLHVLVLLEFQSTDDETMALRVLEYTAMLYRELVREGHRGPDGLLPPVLPVVLYNGDAPWRSASEIRDLIATTGRALAPFQPSQRHIVLDERRTRADDPNLGDLNVLEGSAARRTERTDAGVRRLAGSADAATGRRG